MVLQLVPLGGFGACGIFKNPRGYMVYAFAFNTGINFAYLAELHAYVFVVKKAKELGWNNL